MNYPKELIVKMKKVEYICDTNIGNVLNGNHEGEKQSVLKVPIQKNDRDDFGICSN
jgi:hypothetical protein